MVIFRRKCWKGVFPYMTNLEIMKACLLYYNSLYIRITGFIKFNNSRVVIDENRPNLVFNFF